MPIHYGMVGGESYDEVPRRESTLREPARNQGVAVEVVPPGGWLTWRALSWSTRTIPNGLERR